MKKLIVLLVVSLSFLAAPVSMGTEQLNTTSSDEIDLHGDFPAIKIRSLVKPVQAFITGRSIEVDFNVTTPGIIIIYVYDETGSTVYQQSVTAYAGQQIFVDITSFEEGEYTIEFASSQGGYLSGDFVIE